jgi:hypothetical protein
MRQKSGGPSFKASSRQIVPKTLSEKQHPTQKRANGVSQGVGPEFKHRYHKKKKKKLLQLNNKKHVTQLKN